MSRPKLLFLQTEDWSFWSHRMPMARAAQAAGYEVVVAVRVAAHGERIRAEGIRVLPVDWRRSGINPFKEIATLFSIVRIYASERPSLVHQVSAKPILYGSFAARLCGVDSVINALVGLGFVFSSNSLKARVLRPFVRGALRASLSHKNSRTIFQNPDDFALFVTEGLIDPRRAVLIKGSGVDVSKFVPAEEPPGPPLVVLTARMLWEKGVGEFVEAARRLRADGVAARFALVGVPDSGNPTAVPEEQLSKWQSEGVVECWGHREDMPRVLAQASIACLPSYYGEGLPKALIEAAAAGRPMVAADVPGSREIVRHERTGLMVPPKDSEALAAALRRLIQDKELRERLGRNARAAACEEFSEQTVTAQTLAVYDSLHAKMSGATA